MAQSAIKAGDFKKDIDLNQFAFDLYSLLLGSHYYDKLLNDTELIKHQERSLDELLAKYATPEVLIKI